MKPRKVTLLAAGVLVAVTRLLLAGDAPKEDAAKKDQDRLQGTWVVVAAERDGRPLDRIKGGKLMIDGNGFVIQTASGAELKGTFMLDPTKKPKAMDLQHDAGLLRDKTWKAIYQVDGGDLKICYAEADSGKDRPTEFTTALGSGFLLTVLKRDKP
jgi:uncharacterized protein (TIGR03067 family)